MRVFLTGGTGYIGSAVLDALIRAGHHVTALARDSEKAERLEARGRHAAAGRPRRAGALPRRRCSSWTPWSTPRWPSSRAARRWSARSSTRCCRRWPAARRRGAFIYTSGVWVLGARPMPAAEDVAPDPIAHVTWRAAHEAQVLAVAGGPLTTVVIRPGIVYGGGRGIVSDMLRDALNGLVRVIGDGRNRWPCVYDRDLAELYVRVLAAPGASGIFHATGEEDERVADIAEAITPHVSPVADIRHVPLAEARGKLGHYADALALDQVVRSPRARALGWSPTMHGITGNAPRLFEEYRRAARE